MKSQKGIIILVVVLIVLPVVADTVISTLVPGRESSLGMSKQMIIGMMNFLPMLIVYLLIAFTVIFLYRKWKKGQTKKHE